MHPSNRRNYTAGPHFRSPDSPRIRARESVASGRRAFGRILRWLLLAGALTGFLLVNSPENGFVLAQKAGSVDLLIRNGRVLTLNSSFEEFNPGFVAIRGSTIAGIGPMSSAGRFVARRTLDANGMIVMPGLINTHTHAPMTLLRGLGGDTNLMEWLQKYIFPAEARNVDPDMVHWGTLLACYEMIQSGTTTFVDMYYFEDRIAEAAKSAGMRAILGETVIDMPVPDSKSAAETLAYTRKFIERWRRDPVITPAVAPHAPYTCSAATLQASQKLANDYGVPLIIHLSETEAEVKTIREKYGSTPAAYLESLGFLQDSLIAAHCVWITEDEIPLMKRRGVGISHNPESNMKLASGVAPLSGFLQAGLDVGLGTDGAASNNNLDLFEEMDTAAKLHKLHLKNPAFLNAREVLRLATSGGAGVINRSGDLGTIEEGKLADIILVRTDYASALPMYDVYAHLVYSLKGNSVDTAIIHGKVVMQQRVVRTIPYDMLAKNVRRLQAKIARSVGL